jgi:hypothetical protein
MTFDKDIIGICAGIQSMVVATTDAIYVVSGTHPAAVSQMRLPIPAGGVSPYAMCNVEGAVAVATYDGIVLVTGSQATLALSQKLFTREEWLSRYKAYLPELTLAYNDGHLVGMFKNIGGFVIRTDEATGTFTRLGTTAHALARIPPEDALVFSSTDANVSTAGELASGLRVYRFCGSTNSYMSADWHSKEYVFTRLESMGAFYFRGDGSATLTFYLDGSPYYAVVCTSGYGRIPAAHGGRDGRGLRWSVRVMTTAPVYEIGMAQTMGELKSA